jgi:hypothetical protein
MELQGYLQEPRADKPGPDGKFPHAPRSSHVVGACARPGFWWPPDPAGAIRSGDSAPHLLG